MNQPTPAEIAEAKELLENSLTIQSHVSVIDDGEGKKVVPLSQSLATILAALEAAEKERDGYETLYIKECKESLKSATEAGDEERLKEQMQHARDLEYDRATRAEARCKELEKSGDALKDALLAALNSIHFPKKEGTEIEEWNELTEAK